MQAIPEVARADESSSGGLSGNTVDGDSIKASDLDSISQRRPVWNPAFNFPSPLVIILSRNHLPTLTIPTGTATSSTSKTTVLIQRSVQQ
ncbi:hypothetical protein E1B28_009682 [Marasmius oreades]|uniref:Uncharacterized protein n=1 Tax=Marasmius oreades TaxID=181124 RepID=A0A9P7UQZ6_9AGAR|nr:uncharacterized protein E1B28_009682 [Marasmius oreades]KAG7090575.1 hypothetical protein E1B28_009682 [Marasmius oreades]